MTLMITKVDTENAPKAIGPYSQAVKAGSFLFISGTLPIDPATGKLVGDNIRDQTTQVLKNLLAILEDQGLSFDHVVKSEVYLQDINDFKMLNEIYAEKFTGKVKPARQTMQVAALPLGSLVEISCIAFFG